MELLISNHSPPLALRLPVVGVDLALYLSVSQQFGHLCRSQLFLWGYVRDDTLHSVPRLQEAMLTY